MIWIAILLVFLFVSLLVLFMVSAYRKGMKGQKAMDETIKALSDGIRHSDETARHCIDVLDLYRGKIQPEQTLAFKQKHGHAHD